MDAGTIITLSIMEGAFVIFVVVDLYLLRRPLKKLDKKAEKYRYRGF